MAKFKWLKTNHKGLRYREHATKKHGVKKDRFYQYRIMTDGNRIQESFGWLSEGFSEEKCIVEIAKMKQARINGERAITLKARRQISKEVEIQQKRDNKTFAEFFNEIYLPMTSKHKKKHTVKNEAGIFKNWINLEIGHLPFNKIKPFNLEKIKKNMLDAGRTPRSVQLVFATFRQVWNHARINDFINGDSPTRKVKLPKVKNKRLRFFSHKEADILLNSLKNKSQQVHDMTLFSLHTGARAGEIFSLIWGVVDLENDTAQLRDSKGTDRHAYLTDATKQIFKRLYDGQSSNALVFQDTLGKKIVKISKTFFRTIKELGLNDGVTDSRDKALFHTCRHTFASWHVQNGTDLYTVKELLGHSTIQLTERYSHLKPDGLKQTAKVFDNIVKQTGVVQCAM